MMTRFYLLILSFAVILLTSIASCSANDGEKQEVKAYDSVQNESELFHLILEKKFEGALQRLKEVPSEARVLIEILGGEKGKQVVLDGLPLHFAFSVDIPKNLPLSKRQGGMEKEQVDLIMALMKENPLAVSQMDKLGRLPLHLALISPNPPTMDVIMTLLEIYPKAARMKGLQGLTPLHMAVAYPMTTFENVYAVLAKSQESTMIHDDDGSLPIHTASWGGNVPDADRVIQLLLMQNPKQLMERDEEDDTPLSLMAKYGRTTEAAVRFVIQQDPKAAYRFQDERDSNTLLHYAVLSSMEQNNTVYKPFVDLHSDLLKRPNRLGRLPLHLSLLSCCADSDIVLELMERYPAATKARDGQGYLPLHHACNAGVSDFDIVQKLIDISPETVKVEASLEGNPRGPLPLHLALAHGINHGELHDTMNKVIELLLSLYAEAATLRDPDSDILPMHQAFLSRRSAPVLLRLMKMSPDEISTRIFVSEAGERKTTTLLHLFVSQSHGYMEPKEVVEILNAFEAYEPGLFKEVDSDGRLPLHMVWMQFETKEESRRALVDTLIRINPDAVHAVDKTNNMPLAYIVRARDLYSFDKIFPLNPFAAAIKSTDDFYPLHHLCYHGATGDFSESVDKMMTALLAQHSAAARERDQKGNLPLHHFCHTIGPSHAGSHTFQKLLYAYPEALNMTDDSGLLPLQLVTVAAIESDDASEHEFWSQIMDLLIDENPTAVSVVSKGKPPLAELLDKIETLSVHRRNNDDHLLKIANRLFDVYPDAIKQSMGKKRSGLKSLLVLLGDMGGMAPSGWCSLTLKVIRLFPELAQMKDIHGRTALHVFTLYLGDTAVGNREFQDPLTRELTPDIEHVYITLLQAYPEALNVRDEYFLTPSEIAAHDRLRYARGGRRFYNSPIINMMKHHLRRGADYHLMKIVIRETKSCDDLGRALEKLKVELLEKLDDLEIDPSIGAAGTCDSNSTSLCQSCPAQQESLGLVESYLKLYGDTLEEKSKDENEISGDYYVNAKGEYINED